MHNGQLADPLNKWSIASKKISSKRSKTEADHEELARLAFFGGLYMGEDGPVIPVRVIEATIISAAKKSKEGPLAKLGFYAEDHIKLEYEGPKTAKELWDLKDGFISQELVGVNQSRIVRTRPLFKEWSGQLTLSYDSTVIDQDQVIHWVKVAGLQIGFCDWRPKYGRFEVLDYS